MQVCLSPNGRAESSGDGPATRLLIATIRGLVVLERSSSAEPWQETYRAIEDRHISSLLIDAPSGTIFAGIHGRGDEGGLLASIDGGVSFSPRINGLRHTHIFTLAARQRGGVTELFAGAEPTSLFRSHDLGESWHEVPTILDVPGTEKWTFPPPPHIAHVKNVTFDPRDADTIYLCVEQGALLKSTDNAKTWRELDAMWSDRDAFYRDMHRVAICRNDNRHLFVATGEGLYRSLDAGESWEHVQGIDDRIGYPDGLFIDPRDDRTVYMGGAGNAPETWRVRGSSFSGFIVSRDGGEAWQEQMGGMPDPIIGNLEAFAMHSHGDNLAFYAGTAIGEIYGSEDGGNHWTLIAEGLPPASKGRHYRHFLSADEKFALEEKGRAERRAEGLADKDYVTNA